MILRENGGSFVRVPEEIKALFENDLGFTVREDRDAADYLYRISDLTELAGRKYDGKRNLIKKFRAQQAYEYAALTASDIHECLDFGRKWCIVKDCDNIESLDQERRALREMVDHFSDFGLIAGAIRIRGEVAAIAIAERLNPDTMVMHILKADAALPGLYQTMMNEFLIHERRGFEQVNLEQDLGVEGLRKAKLSYHPARLVNKYTISVR